MTFLSKLLMPKKLMMAGWIMIATLSLAIVIQYFTGFETARYVKIVFYYLLLDYCWTSFRREWLGDGF